MKVMHEMQKITSGARFGLRSSSTSSWTWRGLLGRLLRGGADSRTVVDRDIVGEGNG